MVPPMENTIGIDLGTTNCCVAFMRNGHIEIVPNLNTDERTTPSYVLFHENRTHVGKFAASQQMLHPRRVIYDSKRMIGRSFHDNNIQKNCGYWNFEIEEGPSSKPKIRVPLENGSKTYFPEEISAIILKHLKNEAERFIGKPVTNAVVTVPAYFNYHQRTATQRAAEEAGLKVLQIINEPTAAALAYVDVNYKNQNYNKTIVIYDLGGGTFDVSILKISKDENGESYEVLATCGDTYLGGRDFDNNLTNLIIEKLCDRNVRITKPLTTRVSALATKAKIQLTQADHTCVILPIAKKDDFEELSIALQRSEFESINQNLFKRTIDILEKSLEDVGLNKKDIDEVVLVGGSSKIPKIQEMLRSFFGDVHVSEAVSSSEAVAYGAAVKAATFDEDCVKKLLIQDVTPLSLGIAVNGGIMSFLIGRNSRIPTELKETFFTTTDNQKAIRFQIYEGERPLVKYNTKVGSFLAKFPPKAMGGPIEISFGVDPNGIVQVGLELDSGEYQNLKIHYAPTDGTSATNLVEEAEVNRTHDETKLKWVQRISNFVEYLNKIEAVCNKKSKLTHGERNTLTKIYSDNTTWIITELEKNDLSEETDKRVSERIKEAEAISEKIFLKHGYAVKETLLYNFPKFLDNL